MTAYADWSDGWQQRVPARLQELGYFNILDFIARHEGASYAKLAELLGTHVAPAQLTLLQYDEAEKQGAIRSAAKDAFVREFGAMLAGKKWGEVGDFEKAKLASFWICGLNFRAHHRDAIAETARKVWRALVALPPPHEWMPSSSSDPVLTAAFDAVWPVEV